MANGQQAGVRIDIGSGVQPRAAPRGHEKPWRKPAEAVRAERALTRQLLGPPREGDAIADVRRVLAARDAAGGAHADVEDAATALLEAATNARPRAEVDAARARLDAAVERAGLAGAVGGWLRGGAGGAGGGGAMRKLELLHEVIPRLWLGGWAALNDHRRALQSRGVTHVVSVLSAEQRKLPPFIKKHHYVQVDDREAAADEIASHFEEIARFIEAALSEGGVVFVHCGAGISRAPTATIAYLIWKLRIPAAEALALVRRARSCVRPNAGFVRKLKEWEDACLAQAPSSI
ncbi:hypothetical protein AB1Y20_009170 [Prymnesium parvum]|uniref:Protein-serine/threonine phosphatase n=1 Tax=Prymnesium parvum TaxID=97485 RepID=A0AB34K421_PRYPA